MTEYKEQLLSSIRMFTGNLPPGFADEKEFFVSSFFTMSEYLAHLQKEELDKMCEAYLRAVEAGAATPEAADRFRAGLSRLISAADLLALGGSFSGNKEHVKRACYALKPLSMIAEEKKASGGDQEAGRRITEVYTRLNFAALLEKVEAAPGDAAANAALAAARKKISDYCGLQRIPMREREEVTPFALHCLDAALAAVYRLFKGIREATGRAI